MADTVKIEVETRSPQKNQGTGTRASRRLRAQGKVPAIIYGHKQDPVPIALQRETVWDMIKPATHLAELSLAGASASEMVLIRDVQWDHLGKEIIHLDFARVSAEESIETEVRLDLKGAISGMISGGILEHLVHSVSVTCRAGAIPDSIKVDISHLQIGQSIHVRDLILPEDVKVNADPDLLLVHLVAKAVEAAATPAAEGEGTTQPEVIKPERKDKEE